MKSYTVQVRNKPYHLLLLTGLILVFTSVFLSDQNSTVDLHVHDTYFIIAHAHVLWLLAILAFAVWIIYLLTNKMLYSKRLVWFHVIITILTLGLFSMSLLFGEHFLNPTPRDYYDFNNWDSLQGYPSFAKIIAITIFVLLFGQIIFFINLIVGLFKRKT